jgi:beta-lactamase regulating signal transducer with metallopeptidase domain
MKLDRANRSFLAFIGIALLSGAIVLCGAVGAVLLPLILAPHSRWGVSSVPAIMFIAPIAAGLGLGSCSLGRQVLASHRLARRVRRLAVATPDDLKRSATHAGLAGRIVLVDAAEAFSFVYGVFNPRVAVSRGLCDSASPGELRAVLEHERYHVCNLDPLKMLVLRALSATLFFLPVLSSLRARYVTGCELAADRRAVLTCGRRPLVGALLKVVRGPEWNELHMAASLGGHELLDARVAQLETGREPRLAALSLTRVIASFLMAVTLAAAYAVSVASFGPTAVHHLTGTGLADATIRGGLSCGAPFAGIGLVLYLLAAMRATRPLKPGL